MLFYFLSAVGLLAISSTIFIVGTCYYLLIQSMRQKSTATASNLINLKQNQPNSIQSVVNQ